MAAFWRKATALTELLEVLDRSARRKGYVNYFAVQNAFAQITKQPTCDHEHALMLIRCCGNVLLSELPSTRQSLAEKMFHEFRGRLAGGFQLVHLNSLLRVGIQNFTPVTEIGPDKLMQVAESQRIETNDLFWRLVLEWHSISGASEEACNEALSRIKSRPTARVYNLLMYSYLSSGKFGEAEAVAAEQEHSGLQDPLGKVMQVMMLAGSQQRDDEAVRLLDSYSVNHDEVSPLQDRSYEPLAFLLRYAAENRFDLLLRRCYEAIQTHKWPLQQLCLSLINICQRLVACDRRQDVAHNAVLSFPADLDVPLWRFLMRMFLRHCVLSSVDCTATCLALDEREDSQGFYATHSALRESIANGDDSFLVWLANQARYPLKLHYFYPLLRSENANLDSLLDLAIAYFGPGLASDPTFLKLTVVALLGQGRFVQDIGDVLSRLHVNQPYERILQARCDL